MCFKQLSTFSGFFKTWEPWTHFNFYFISGLMCKYMHVVHIMFKSRKLYLGGTRVSPWSYMQSKTGKPSI